MPTTTKLIATGTISPGEMHLLHSEAKAKSASLGALCTRVRCEVGDPDDSLIFDFNSDPDDAAIDALIAGYPSTTAPVGTSFAAAANTTYLLADEPIGIGEHVLLEYHLLATLGTVAASQPQSERGYMLVWRGSANNVKVNLSPAFSVGEIPSFRVVAVGTAETAQLSIRMGKAGTFTIGHWSISRVLTQVLS